MRKYLSHKMSRMVPSRHRRPSTGYFADGGVLNPDFTGLALIGNAGSPLSYSLATDIMDNSNNEFAKGGKIHIKKSHEGLFTQAAKRAGMGVQQYASHVLNDPHASATMKKRANFARNAAKWKHSLGGSLYEIGGVMQSNGTNFPTGITEINNGGTHEQNPYEGVQMGVDSEGTPNLVEEGEVVWNNYVFSNRIPVPAEVKKAMGLGTNRMTFADASKKLSKGIKERPNDPIEADALETNMSRLAQAQEQIRQQMQQEEDMKAAREMQYMQQLGMAAYGGNLFSGGLFRRKNKFPEGGPFDLQSLNDLLANKKEPYSFEPSQALALRMQNMNKTRSSNDNDNDVDNDSNTNPLTFLRLAPIINSSVATLTDMLGLSNKYDYTNTNITKNLAGNILSNYNPIRTRAISDYLTYNPLDRDYMANKISASAAAARRTAMNNNAANQAARNALLGSLNYSSLSGLGDALMNIDAKNFERQKEVAAHNANINELNAKQAAAADTANAQNRNYLLGLYNTDMNAALKMKQDMEDATDAAKAANRNALITNLGGLGKETVQGEWIKNHPALDYYFNLITGNASYKPDVSAFGGMLTRRKRKNCRRR